MSTVERAMNGFMLGGSIGVAAGTVFGTMQALGSGVRGRRLLHSIAFNILVAGVTFGTLVSVGSVVRSEGKEVNMVRQPTGDRRDKAA
eukprot:m.28561 g.28561  ORF g.28561 m.28561 type:complete len:88 (-) comp4528_c0_seq1:189-452(-)